MGLVERHKKPGGFKKLVNSLETTPADRQQKILDAMRLEDPDFVSEVEVCIFAFEEFLSIDDLIVCEIIGAMRKEMRMLALALYRSDEKLVQKFTKNMRPPEMREYRDFSESFKSVLQREQVGARFRIIVKARELEGQKKFMLKKYSAHYRED